MGKFRIGQTILLTGIILSSESIGENRAGNHSTPSPRTSANSPTYTIKLPTYDSERVQKVTQELLENFREKRPENWEALERAAGYVPWNQVPSRSLPAFDADKVSGAVEKLATEISQERPGSWDDLKGILKNYTGTIPPAVMENIIAYRILQRKASDANSDGLENIMRTPKPAAESNNVGAPTPKAAMDSVASNKIGLFSQFFPSGSSAPSPMVPNAPSPATPKGSATGSFPFVDNKPNASAPASRETKPSPTSVTSDSSAPAPAIGKTPVSAGFLPTPAVAGKIPVAPPSPATTLAENKAVPAKIEPPAATKTSVLPKIFTGEILKNANAPLMEAKYTIAEPSPEPEETESNAEIAYPGPDSSVVSSAPSSSFSEEVSEEESPWSGLLAFVRAWLLAAIDAGPEMTAPKVPPRSLASLGSFNSNAPEFHWLDRAARRQAIVDLGDAVGLEAGSSLLIYHCALAVAWLATLVFTVWAGFRLWLWRRSQDPSVTS